MINASIFPLFANDILDQPVNLFSLFHIDGILSPKAYLAIATDSNFLDLESKKISIKDFSDGMLTYINKILHIVRNEMKGMDEIIKLAYN